MGKLRTPVYVLDESAGGFACLVRGSPGAEVDEVAHLRTAAGWFEVRVASVGCVETPPDDGETPEEGRGPTFRLGLCRLGEIDPPEDERAAAARGRLHFRLAQLFPSGKSMLVVGIVFALVAVLVPLSAAMVLWHRDHPLVKKLALWMEPEVVSSSSPSPGVPHQGHGDAVRRDDSANERNRNRGPAQPADRPDPTPRATGGSTPTGITDELQKAIQRLSGAAAFAVPEVAHHLTLSQSQQQQIRRIMETTARALQDLDVQWRGRSRQELSQQGAILLDSARREALKTLTEEQQARWEELVGQESGAVGRSKKGTGDL